MAIGRGRWLSVGKRDQEDFSLRVIHGKQLCGFILGLRINDEGTG